MMKNKGITLIALVITIIVLLILVGAAIAMLSGENGILKKAAEAKTKTEQAQKEEETRLTDMETTANFFTNNIKYRIKNGYMTGFTVGDKVSDINSKLEPLGYKINLKYDYENDKDIVIGEDENPFIATGMSVQKNGQTVARTVVFGDINCNSEVNADDNIIILGILESSKTKIKEDFIKVAMDIDHNKNISNDDVNKFLQILGGGSDKINQDVDANNSNDINILGRDLATKAFVDNLPSGFQGLVDEQGYEIKYNETASQYDLIVPTGTKANEITDVISRSQIITKDEDGNENEIVDTIPASNAQLKIPGRFKYGFNIIYFELKLK